MDDRYLDPIYNVTDGCIENLGEHYISRNM